MICVLYNNTQKNARKNTKKDRKNPKKYIISMNNAFNNLCEVSNSRVKSNADAIGLMQLMEETAIERSNVIDNQDIAAYDLYDPETNIKLGTSYLAYLLNLYNGNTVLAITAYNAGLGNVKQWIKDGTIKSDGSDVENIPYKETENYVRKILRDYQMYLKIYE